MAAILALLYRFRHKLRIELAKIIIGFYSLLAVVGDTFGIRWPDEFEEIVSALRSVFAGVFQVGAFSCEFQFTQIDEMWFWTLGTLSVLGLIYLHYRWQQKPKGALAKRVFYVALFAYPFISTACVSVFMCREVAGTSYLIADYRVQCHTTGWYVSVVWSALLVVIYIVGLPCAIVFVLGSPGLRESLSFVSDGYRDGGIQPYWEVLEMLRKLCLSSVVLAFEKGSALQISAATIVSVFFLVLHVSFEPFERASDNRLQTLALSSLFGTYFLGILLQVKASSSQNKAFAGLLTVMSFVVAIVALSNTLLRIYHSARGVLTTATTTINQSHSNAKRDSGIELESVSVENPAYAGSDQDADSATGGIVLEPRFSEERKGSALDGGDRAAEVAALKAELARTKAARGEYVAQRVAGVKQQLEAERAQLKAEHERTEQQLEAERDRNATMGAKMAELESELAASRS
jgi:hypothetical protein